MRVVLVRHGATEWSASGQHTSRTDIPLTEAGREAARALAAAGGREFALVLSLAAGARARDRRAGRLRAARSTPTSSRSTTATTRAARRRRSARSGPGWTLWRDGSPGGETLAQAGERVDRVIARALAADGDVAIFAHGHILRVLAARWIGLPPEQGARFALDTASISELGFERETRVIARWNT